GVNTGIVMGSNPSTKDEITPSVLWMDQNNRLEYSQNPDAERTKTFKTSIGANARSIWSNRGRKTVRTRFQTRSNL
ncbi:MAG: hypothetical protein EBX52_11120, partial [Proteobacteria bacterium]|nr:hypothetical protein [Pseudomonadota bacterium]